MRVQQIPTDRIYEIQGIAYRIQYFLLSYTVRYHFEGSCIHFAATQAQVYRHSEDNIQLRMSYAVR